MNGLEISHILSLDPYTSQYFKGFGMSDMLKLSFRNSPSALYILNTDTSSGPGEHWCAVYFENSKGEFFDPFGEPPESYNFPNLIESRSFAKMIHNPIRVQSLTSTTCGQHCIFYSLNRCRGSSMKEILNMYDIRNTAKNDEMVYNVVQKFRQVV